MAHAGTPTDLAQKPATSTNGLWQPLLAVIVILAIGVGMALVASAVATSRSVAAPAADGGYTQVETLRGGTTFAAAPRIEAQRGPTTAAAAQIYVGAQRGPTTAAAALIYVEDHSSLQAEKNRGGALIGGSRDQGEGGFGGQ